MASLSCGADGSSAPDLLTILTVFRHSRITSVLWPLKAKFIYEACNGIQLPLSIREGMW